MPRNRGRVHGRRFPHLLAEDADIWSVWLKEFGSSYERFEYDVRVGYGTDPGPGIGAAYRSMAWDLSHRRIDAIGYRPHELELFEVTRLVGFKTVGQFVGYPVLYNLSGRTNLRLHMSIVAAELGGDMLYVLQALGATTWLVDVERGTVREAFQR